MADTKVSKGGVSKDMAFVEGVRIAQQVARSWRMAATRVGCADEAVSAALEGVTLAWESWVPERGPWAAHAAAWAKAYVMREIQKYRSVVTTNYARRTAAFDGALLVTGKDNDHKYDVAERFTCSAHVEATGESGADDVVDARMALARIQTRLQEAAKGLSGAEGAMAGDIVARILAGDDGEPLADIAARHGYTRQSAYRAEWKLREVLSA